MSVYCLTCFIACFISCFVLLPDTDVGPKTCAGYEGSYGHETVDAQTYASWGIDFVEEDSCYHSGTMPPYQASSQVVLSMLLRCVPGCCCCC
jgi:hypothetical protein